MVGMVLLDRGTANKDAHFEQPFLARVHALSRCYGNLRLCYLPRPPLEPRVAQSSGRDDHRADRLHVVIIALKGVQWSIRNWVPRRWRARPLEDEP